MHIKLKKNCQDVKMLRLYAPNIQGSLERKILFYDLLSTEFAAKPHRVLLLADFNTFVDNDTTTCPNIIGSHSLKGEGNRQK
ncbi:craniofacial development protein 2-like, partial [Clarias magur]